MNTYLYKITDLQRDKDGIIVTDAFTITASDGVDELKSFKERKAVRSGTPW